MRMKTWNLLRLSWTSKSHPPVSFPTVLSDLDKSWERPIWAFLHIEPVKCGKNFMCTKESELVLLTWHLHLSHSLADRWGTTVEFTTSFLHFSRFPAFRSMIFHSKPVHSLMLSLHRFLCLPLCLPHWTVPCSIVLASPDDHVTCPYYFSLHLSIQPNGVCNSGFNFLTGYVISVWDTEEFVETSRLNVCILLPMSAVMVHVSHGI